MTTAPVASNPTIESLLLGDPLGGPTDPGAALAAPLQTPAMVAMVAARLPAMASSSHRAVLDALAGVLGQLGAEDVRDVLVRAWQAHSAMTEAAHASRTDPANPRVVELLAHRVTYAKRPVVELLLDGRRVGQLSVEMLLVFQVTSLAAAWQAGRLASLRFGRIELVASVAVEGVTVAKRRAEMDARLSIDVRRIPPPHPVS